MEPRARTRLNLRRAGLLAALTALLVPAVAGTATADAAKRKKNKRSPVVTRVTPTNASIGETLTIRGRNFRRGRERNTVLFKRRHAKAVFVKARISTRKLMKVELPERLEDKLLVQNGTRVETRFALRVLAKRLGRKWSKGKRRRPLIGPVKPPAPPEPPEAAPDGDCDGDGALNRVDADDDNDLLADTLELQLKLDPCNPDTDGDGVTDGYEYQSARDLNDGEHQNPNKYLPYPGKRPYPNPLDATDANTDHDGDSLTLREEFALWNFTGSRDLARLTYSAGEKYSASARVAGGIRKPTLKADGYDKQAEFLAWAQQAGYAQVALADVGNLFADPSANWWDARTVYDIRDMDRSGSVDPVTEARYYSFGDEYLDDAQRDEDADGLSNWMETRGCMSRAHWDGLYDKETPYPLQYSGTLPTDPDTDGDGIRDGADDQDNDDVPNIMECSRELAYGGWPHAPDLPALGAVNPFNPCLPHRKSRTCNSYVTIGQEWAPFNPKDTYYLIKN